MAHRIHVIVTCTQSKRVAPAPELLVRNLPQQSSVQKRCSDWTRRLAKSTEPATPARDLYCGDHWSVALDLEKPTATGKVQLWIISAGHGLVRADDEIQSYGAAFATGGEDSVASGKEGVSEWWRVLTNGNLAPAKKGPQSLRALASGDRGSSILIAASPSYLAAVGEDIAAAAKCLSDPDRMIIVSAGGRADSGILAPYLLRVDARLQQTLGGAMQSLNVRIARDLLRRRRKPGLSLASARRTYDRIQSDLAEYKYPERQPLTDREVLSFIEGELRKNPDATRSRLLRQLRDSGKACEQHRFSKIFSTAGVGLYD